jgi:hypothetical protein
MAALDEFDRANARGKMRKAKTPTAESARYDSRQGKVVVTLTSGVDIAFPPASAQGLEKASAADLKLIDISPSGLGLHFPKLDADIYLPALLDGLLGSRKWMAARLGAEGGKAKSAAKTASSRENGKRGGRPRKVA